MAEAILRDRLFHIYVDKDSFASLAIRQEMSSKQFPTLASFEFPLEKKFTSYN